MGSLLADPRVAILIAFLLGIGVGWLVATVRVKGKIHVSMSPASSGTGNRWAVTKTTQVMELTCACGELLKFRNPVEPGYQPFPSGDSVTCPHCGRVTSLTEIHKLEKDAQAP
jgi:hypothetical protein